MTAREPGDGPVPAAGLAAVRAALGSAAQEVPDALLTQALTHRSWSYEHGGAPTNERLEFLGDAVLGLAVTDALFRAHPDLPESRLAPLRSRVVNTEALASVARDLGLGEHLLLGRGELGTGGRDKTSILADAMEALLGAVHLAAGRDAADALVRRLFAPLMEAAAGARTGDAKTALQELAAARGLGAPAYEVEETGPDHAKRFRARALVGGEPRGEGEGTTKKAAEQQAAADALDALDALDAPAGRA